LDGHTEGVQGEEVLILLLGGTSETAPVANALAAAGMEVLVSTATDNDLDVGDHPSIEHRRGRMDGGEMAALIKERAIDAIVDATHPFAEAVRATARTVADESHLAYFTFIREESSYDYEKISYADNHESAAETAFAFGMPVLLTTGSRNLKPYVDAARRLNMNVTARVLDHEESLKACREAGLESGEVVTGRGPFSLEENLALIKERSIGTIVSKESGKAGGLEEKIESARIGKCNVVLIKRPIHPADNAFSNIETLVKAVVNHMERVKCGKPTA